MISARLLLRVAVPAAVVAAGVAIVRLHSSPPPLAAPSARLRPVDDRPAMRGGFGQGFGRGSAAERAIVGDFDRDGDKRLDRVERREARAYLESMAAGRGRGGRRGAYAPAEPGPRVAPGRVKSYPDSVPLYDAATLRTLFFTFADDDWHEQLLAFHNTDVEVPATLAVDGRTYRDVGVHYRGASSFGMVPADRKHSINLSMDFVHDGQALGGYRTLNLLNSHEDPSYLRTILYLRAAREYVPAPRANYARVVINGESWGAFISQQQFNKDFLREWFDSDEGARWKVPGRPGGRGGLEYSGDDLSQYKQTFEIKTRDDPKAWAALVELCRILNRTPPARLEQEIARVLDVDATLKFLALDNVFVNGDGYWVRASDYAIYLDPKGRFHILPHDANEIFASGSGPGMRGGGGGPELDPLVGLTDTGKPLRSQLLAVPALRDRYLGYVRGIATTWLDWKTLEPIVRQAHAIIEADVKTDTRQLDSYEEFVRSVDDIRDFVTARRDYLLNRSAARAR